METTRDLTKGPKNAKFYGYKKKEKKSKTGFFQTIKNMFKSNVSK